MRSLKSEKWKTGIDTTKSGLLNSWWWKSLTIEKWWAWVSLHGSIKEPSDFCSLSRGRLALLPWTSANLRNNDVSGQKWEAFIKVCSSSPFLATVVLHPAAHYSSVLLNIAGSRVLQQFGLSLSLVNTHLLSSCTAVLVFCSEPFSLMQKGFVYTQLKGTSQCYCFYSKHCCQQSGSKFIDSSS